MFTCYSAQGNQANGAPGGFVLDDRLGGKVLLSVSHSGEHLNETRIDLDDGWQMAFLWPDIEEANGIRAKPLDWLVEIRDGQKVPRCTRSTLPADVAHLVLIGLSHLKVPAPGGASHV